MREPCSARPELAEDDNPLEVKWYNCLNQSDPEPIQSERTRQVLEKLCPNFYVNNRNPAVCCSDNQVTVLKADLARAESILAQCPSCYFNFRMLWCHMTCSPDQHEFLIPRESKRLKYTDFSKQMAAYQNSYKGNGDDEEAEESAAAGGEHDHEHDGGANENNEEQHEHTGVIETSTTHLHEGKEEHETAGEHHDEQEHQHNADETENNEVKEESKRRRRRQTEDEDNHPKIDVLTSIIYYLREESVSRLVDSCR